MIRTRALAASLIAALSLPVAALAATPAPSGPTMGYYNPPKLLKRGTNTSPIAGQGSVVLKVLVNKDGTFKVQGILKSTNHGNDQAALEIARSSTYKAATKGGKPQLAFYDFTLNFNAGGSASTMGDQSELGRLERMLHAGNFSGAQSGLNDYLKQHADEPRASLDLGLADSFLYDYEGAATAFDKAGTIPQNYRSVAGKSYAEAAILLAKAKKNDAAVAAGRHGVDLAPGFGTYNALGFSEYGAGQFAIAAVDLEKARTLAVSEGISAQQRALVDANLMSAYVSAGNLDMAQKIADEAKTLDPTVSKNLDLSFANYYGNQARDKINAKLYTDAAALFEKGAAAAPSQAALLYAQAARAYLLDPHPDNVKAKADADKAIALDPDSAVGYYAAGIALANTNKTKDALGYLQKADDAAKKAGDAGLVAAIENSIKRLSGTK
jgi:tetratricopeptide (TPR) repeat protein